MQIAHCVITQHNGGFNVATNHGEGEGQGQQLSNRTDRYRAIAKAFNIPVSTLAGEKFIGLQLIIHDMSANQDFYHAFRVMIKRGKREASSDAKTVVR